MSVSSCLERVAVIVTIGRGRLVRSGVHGRTWELVARTAKDIEDLTTIDTGVKLDHKLGMMLAQHAGHATQHVQFHPLHVDLRPMDRPASDCLPEFVESDDEDLTARRSSEGMVGHAPIDCHRLDAEPAGRA